MPPGARNDYPVPVALAIIGVVVALGALMQQWIELDTAKIHAWIGSDAMFEQVRSVRPDLEGAPPDQITAAIGAAMERAEASVEGRFVGWRVLESSSLVLLLAMGFYAVASVFRFRDGSGSRENLGGGLLVSGLALVGVPVWTWMHLSGSPQLEQLFGGSILHAGPGLPLAVFGGMLVLVSGLWVLWSDEPRTHRVADRVDLLAPTVPGALPADAGGVATASAFACSAAATPEPVQLRDLPPAAGPQPVAGQFTPPPVVAPPVPPRGGQPSLAPPGHSGARDRRS